jgi:hypothetical protein
MKYVAWAFLCMIFGILSAHGQQKDPWKESQLMEPSHLAASMKLPESQRPVVIDIGPAGAIKGARVAGPAHEAEGMKNFKAILGTLDKSKEVVIYCGCCPFTRCPNVRPAFQTLLDMGFKHPRLLNLAHNLKADWIDQGYPLADQ